MVVLSEHKCQKVVNASPYSVLLKSLIWANFKKPSQYKCHPRIETTKSPKIFNRSCVTLFSFTKIFDLGKFKKPSQYKCHPRGETTKSLKIFNRPCVTLFSFTKIFDLGKFKISKNFAEICY